MASAMPQAAGSGLPVGRRFRAMAPATGFAVGLLGLVGMALALAFQRPGLGTALTASGWGVGALLMATRRNLRFFTLAAFFMAMGWAITHWLLMNGRNSFVNIDDPWQMIGYLLLGWQVGQLPQRMPPRASLVLLVVFGLFCMSALLAGSFMQHHIPWNTGLAILLCLVILGRAAPAIEAALHGTSPDGRLLWVCGLLAYTGGHVVLSAKELAFPGLNRYAPDAAIIIGSLLLPCGLFAEACRLPLGFWSFVISISALLSTWAIGVLLLAPVRTMLLPWCLFQGILFILAVIGFSMWFSGRAPRVLEEALGRLADVEQQRKTKADFLANLSHELRTPLNAILGFSDLLSTESTLEETARRQATAIRNTGERLLALINDILDLSKLRAGKMQLEPAILDPKAILERVLHALGPAVQARGVKLQLRQSGLPRQMVADKERLGQLLRTVLDMMLSQSRRGQTIHCVLESDSNALAWHCWLEDGRRASRKKADPSLALRLLLAQSLAGLQGGRLEAPQPWDIHLNLPLKPSPASPKTPPAPRPSPVTLSLGVNHRTQLIAATLGFVVPMLLAGARSFALVQGVMATGLLSVAWLLPRQRWWRLASWGLGSIAAFQLIWLPVFLGFITPQGVIWLWISRLDDILWLGGLALLMGVLARLPQGRLPWRGLAGWCVIGLFSLPMVQGIHGETVLSYDFAYTVADLLLLAIGLPRLESALVAEASSGRLLWGFGLVVEWLGHALDGLVPSSLLALQILWAMSMLAVATGLLIEARRLPFGETVLLSCLGGLFVVIVFGLVELSSLQAPLANWLLVGTAALALGALASLSRPQSKLARALGQLDGIYRQRQLLEAEQAQFSNHMKAAMDRHIASLLYHGRALLRSADPEVRETQVEPIVQATEHLQGLVDDVADFTSSTEGAAAMERLEPTMLSLPAVLQSTTTLVKQLAARKNIRLCHEIDSHLPPLRADQRKVKQMLYNYLSNAIKFTPEQGCITISARPISRNAVLTSFQASPGFDGHNLAKATVFVQVCVADSGPGIAPVDQQRLFGHYEQVQQRQSPVSQVVAGLGGTGLGLMMVKTLAQAHGGAVAVESKPGHGSHFYFFLPLQVVLDQSGAMAMAPGAVP
jgi:signal transduction histidine kinase